MMLPVAAAASGQGGFGTKLEKWSEKRQEKNGEEQGRSCSRATTEREQWITTANRKIGHIPLAIPSGLHFFNHSERGNLAFPKLAAIL